jgi:hypothetical protein
MMYRLNRASRKQVREGKLTGGVRRSHRCRTRNNDVGVEAESGEVSQAGSSN